MNKKNSEDITTEITPQAKQQPKAVKKDLEPTLPLTSILLKDIAKLFGKHAKSCYYNLKEVKPLTDPQILAKYGELHSNLSTVSQLFLSFEKDVYLWQINRKCPFRKGTDYFSTDARGKSTNLKQHPSLLVLARITPELNEVIMDASFFGETMIMVKSTAPQPNSKPDVILRLYNIENFVHTARVNPLLEDINANDEYTYKLIMSKKCTQEESNNQLECTMLWRKTLEEVRREFAEDDTEEQKKLKLLNRETVVETASYPHLTQVFNDAEAWFCDSAFEILLEDKTLVLIDKDSATLLMWKGNGFQLIHYPKAGSFESVYHWKDYCYLVNDEYQVYKLDLKALPNVELENPQSTFSPSPATLSNIKHQPKKLYEFTVITNKPYIAYLSDTEFKILSLEAEDENDYYKPIEYKEKLKSAKSFTWRMNSDKHSDYSYGLKLFIVRDNYLDVITYDGGEAIKSVELKSEASLHRLWEIVCLDSEVILYGRLLNKIDLQIIKVNANDGHSFSVQDDLTDNNRLFQHDSAEPAPVQITDRFILIRFDSEPYYIGKQNLMYDEPLSLLNPSEEKRKQDGNADTQENLNQNKNGTQKTLVQIQKKMGDISNASDFSTGIEEAKQAMKELRGDIASKKAATYEFNKEYDKQQKQQQQQKQSQKGADKKEEKLKEPERVKKETTKVYSDLKSEKNKLSKAREKDKQKRKNDR